MPVSARGVVLWHIVEGSSFPIAFLAPSPLSSRPFKSMKTSLFPNRRAFLRNTALSAGESSDVNQLANAIVEGQQAEIDTMNGLLGSSS